MLLSANTRNLGPLESSDQSELQQMLDEAATELAQAIIRDAEGASHFVTLDVRGLRTREEAFRIGKAIADSPLVKTAIAGGDPNWGRIISAAGYAGVTLREEDMTLRLNGTLLYQAGAPSSSMPAKSPVRSGPIATRISSWNSHSETSRSASGRVT